MLFRRRDKPAWQDRLKTWAWPQRGWKRAAAYAWHRITRLAGTPHAIAMGCATGVFASFTPLMGLHFILAALLAYALGGSLLASAFGTFFGNPISFPIIWLTTYNFGGYLLGWEQKSEINIGLPSGFWSNLFMHPTVAAGQFWETVGPVLVPMLAGGIPLGLVFGLAFYFPVKATVETFQKRRQDRLFDKTKNTTQDAATQS